MSNEIASDFNFTPPTATPDANTESLGAWFAQVRASYGADQRDVARHLRLNPAIIQAIETDDFARLGPSVFVRGYLSRYAQLLHLPEQAVLERYRQQLGATQEPPPLKVVHPLRRQTRARDLRGFLYLLLVAGIGWAAVQHLRDLDPGRLLALWSGGHRGSESQSASPPTATTQTQYPFQPKPAEATGEPSKPTLTPPAGESLATAGPAPAPAAITATSHPPESPAPLFPLERAPLLATPGIGIAPAASASSETPASETGGQTPISDADFAAKLLLEFSNDCWVEVKDAQGNVLVSGLMRANSTHTLSGPAPFKVTLGNAPAARLILDDRLVDTAVYVPRRGTVSRFILDRGQP